ncbi:hypothetical protein Tco_1516315 [Tanacetum coccineum]
MALTKDEEVVKLGVTNPIRSMIGSLMYLTASRPDIMFAVSCLFLGIFGYSKSFHTLMLEIPTSGCQLSWEAENLQWQMQEKQKQIVATSTTEAEYVAAAMLWSIMWIQIKFCCLSVIVIYSRVYMAAALLLVEVPSARVEGRHISYDFLELLFKKFYTVSYGKPLATLLSGFTGEDTPLGYESSAVFSWCCRQLLSLCCAEQASSQKMISLNDTIAQYWVCPYGNLYDFSSSIKGAVGRLFVGSCGWLFWSALAGRQGLRVFWGRGEVERGFGGREGTDRGADETDRLDRWRLCLLTLLASETTGIMVHFTGITLDGRLLQGWSFIKERITDFHMKALSEEVSGVVTSR